MRNLFLATVLTGAMAVPALADMSHDVSCADFMAMDANAQMEALEQMAEDGMAADSVAADDLATHDDMGSGDMATAQEGTGSDEMMADHAVSVEAAAAVCTDNPDMMVSDAMTKAGGN
jgi:hypothetical protein